MTEKKYDGDVSDGYHTFNELYAFRRMYNAALFNEWALAGKYEVHKSKLHHDGEHPFGKPGMFIVAAMLPDGQISNHYETCFWDLFIVPEHPKSIFKHDGHNSEDVLYRLQQLIKSESILELVTHDPHQIPMRHCDCGRTVKTNLKYCSLCGRYFQGVLCNDSKTGKEITIPKTSHNRYRDEDIPFEFDRCLFGAYLSSFRLPCDLPIHFFTEDQVVLTVLMPNTTNQMHLPSVATIQRESYIIAEEIQKSGSYDRINYQHYS